MTTRKLKVTVAGQANTGKSTIAQLLRCVLADAGIKVKIVNDPDILPGQAVPDLPKELILRNLIGTRDDLEVEIEQVQLARTPSEG